MSVHQPEVAVAMYSVYAVGFVTQVAKKTSTPIRSHLYGRCVDSTPLSMYEMFPGCDTCCDTFPLS